MRVLLPYGGRELGMEIPDQSLQDVALPNPLISPADQAGEVRRAIENPIGMPPLEEWVKPDQTVAILCDDISRPTPTWLILPILLQKLNDIGLRDAQIFVVFALGSHRPMTEAEIERKLGKAVKTRLSYYQSQFDNPSQQTYLGQTKEGVRIWADRKAMAADLRIGIGSIVPHPAVGWSGGGKIIYPGITGKNTVTAFHLRHGRTVQNMFGMEESPVRLEMEQWVNQVGLHFIINVVGKPEGLIYKAVAGDFIRAHRVGVDYAKRLFGVKLRSRADVAVVNSYPAEDDFWQATKGVLAGESIVKDGGTLILVSPCTEGIGPHPHYPAAIGDPDWETKLQSEFISSGTGADPLAIAVAATIARIQRRIRLALVSEGIDAAESEKAGFIQYSSIDEALNAVLPQYGPTGKVSVLPYGAETVPMVQCERG